VDTQWIPAWSRESFPALVAACEDDAADAACHDRLVVPTAVSPAMRRLLAEVAARVPQGDDGSGCVRVAVDGVDGAGKTTFADLLAEQLRSTGREVLRISADDFHHPRAVRHQRGRNSPEGFWLDTYDYAALRDKVLDPLGPGGSRRYKTAAHDLDSDQALNPPWCEAPPGTILILDGMFLHRDELSDNWDLSIFLQVPFSVSVARLASRDGGNPDPEHPSLARYVQGQRLYLAACSPWDRADLIVDYADLEAPLLAPE
jgi:uridine kinase